MNSVTNISSSVTRDPGGRPIGINRRPSPSTSVGARAADEGLGGPLWSPASCSSDSNLAGTRPPPHPAGDPKGPPFPASSTLAPTDRPASRLASRLRLMPLGRPRGALSLLDVIASIRIVDGNGETALVELPGSEFEGAHSAFVERVFPGDGFSLLK